jgi:SPP1 gp7 family putative phage head morphogenesis protein
MRHVDEAGGPSIETLGAEYAYNVDEKLVRATEELLAVSYLLGRDHAKPPRDLADDPEIPAIPFDEAVGFLRARVPLTKAEWSSLEPQLRFRAFTVAALATPDAIDRVRKSAISAVQDGTGLAEFWTKTAAEASAGIGAKPFYWETVYRTNVQTAYNAGRAAEFMRSQPEYLEFVGIEDNRQTEICAQRSGTILPATHPFWKSNWPPLHFNCRSTIRAVYQEEVDVLRAHDPNWEPTSDARITRDPPASGFGANPIETGSFYKLTPEMIKRASLYGIREDIEAFGKSLGLKDLSIPAVKVNPPRSSKPTKKKNTPLFDNLKDPELKTLAQDSFKNAPAHIRTVAGAHADTFTYRKAPGGSYYNSAEKSITIGTERTSFTFSHEFGHGIDHTAGAWFSGTPEFKVAFEKDLATIIDQTSNHITAKGKEIIEKMESLNWKNNPPISDLFSGLTKGRIQGRWGHSMTYWSYQNTRTAEVFANLFSLKASGDADLWEAVREYVPSLCDAIDNFIGRL